MTTENKRLVTILGAALFLLLIPFTAMQFSDEVNWSAFDFVVAGGLLFGLSLLIEFVLRKVKTTQSRALVLAAVLVSFLLLWTELAVGIFGSPLAGS